MRDGPRLAHELGLLRVRLARVRRRLVDGHGVDHWLGLGAVGPGLAGPRVVGLALLRVPGGLGRAVVAVAAAAAAPPSSSIWGSSALALSSLRAAARFAASSFSASRARSAWLVAGASVSMGSSAGASSSIASSTGSSAAGASSISASASAAFFFDPEVVVVQRAGLRLGLLLLLRGSDAAAMACLRARGVFENPWDAATHRGFFFVGAAFASLRNSG